MSIKSFSTASIPPPTPRRKPLLTALIVFIPFLVILLAGIITIGVISLPHYLHKGGGELLLPQDRKNWIGPPGPCYVDRDGDLGFNGTFWCCGNKLFQDYTQVSAPVAGFAEALYLGGNCTRVPAVEKIKEWGMHWQDFCRRDVAVNKPMLGCCHTNRVGRADLQVWCIDMDATADFNS